MTPCHLCKLWHYFNVRNFCDQKITLVGPFAKFRKFSWNSIRRISKILFISWELIFAELDFPDKILRNLIAVKFSDTKVFLVLYLDIDFAAGENAKNTITNCRCRYLEKIGKFSGMSVLKTPLNPPS